MGIVCVGDIKNFVFRGGGCIFGLRLWKYIVCLNKKVKRLVRKFVLFDKVVVGNILIVEDFFFEVLKIKEFINIF